MIDNNVTMETISLLQQKNDQNDYNSIGEGEELFDRYEIKSSEELEKLKDILKGALIITTDSKHIGIHKFFYTAQIIKKTFEKTGVCCKKNKPKPIDPNLCHAMIVVRWDKNKQCPILAHSVMDGVKINAVDYFKPIKHCGRGYKTADGMVVYIPKNKRFRKEIVKNTRLSAEISSEKKNRSPFSWCNLITSIFKKQIYKIPQKTAQMDLAYAVTDILLKRKLSLSSNENKTRPFFCTEYAVCMFQASILTHSLSEEDKNELLSDLKNPSHRMKIATAIYQRITKSKDDLDPLSKAYWKEDLSRLWT